MVKVVNSETFYYDRLGAGGKAVYNKLYGLLCQNQTMPYEISVGKLDHDEIESAYSALYLDKALPQMPPPRTVYFEYYDSFIDKSKIVISSNSPIGSIFIENFEKFNHILSRLKKEFCGLSLFDCQKREKIIAIIKYMHEHSCYRLGDAIGESPLSVLLFYSGYCTGFARTLKCLCPECVCVRGKLKNAFSSVRYADDYSRDIPHMWNAIYDASISEWFFFDPTAHIRSTDSIIKSELDNRFYRKSYADGSFQNPIFMDRRTLEEKYILEDGALWS